MRLIDTFQTAVGGVTTNVSRALLTMLGIIIGIGSVTLMTGIGQSMEGVILGQISILGADNMIIFPGGGPEGGGIQRAGFDSITTADIAAMEKLTTITAIAPTINVSEPVIAGRETAEPQVLASNINYYLNYDIQAVAGRLLDESDEKSRRRVAVLGPDTAKELFFNQNPIGKKIKIGSNSFLVVGVTNALGTAFFQNQDERVYIPLSVAKEITQQDYYNSIPFKRTVDPELAQKDVELLLRQRHNITDPDDDDFIVRSSIQAQQILGSVSIGLTSFITLIAAISLVVGGIGIMNIMLVAVTERTREIGLRKAVGAKSQDILYQFLIEAVVLTVVGGLIGVAGGLLLSYIVALVVNNILADYVFQVSPSAIVLAICMAAGTGFLFGVYPAKRAAEQSPMEALRYE